MNYFRIGTSSLIGVAETIDAIMKMIDMSSRVKLHAAGIAVPIVKNSETMNKSNAERKNEFDNGRDII